MRVAALLPAATDIAVALGAGDHLVAVTHACALPRGLPAIRVTRSRATGQEAPSIDASVSALSAAGEPLFDLDTEALAAARPDLILTQATCEVCAVREADARRVAASLDPAPRVVALDGHTVDGILSDIAVVGRALDLPDEAEELVAGLRSRIRRVHDSLKARQAPRPRVAVIEWTDPPFNAGHWVPDMVRRAGGVDVLGAPGAPSRRLKPADVERADPAVLIVAPCGLALDESAARAHAMIADPRWQWARERSAWVIDANRLTSTPGPGVVRGIEVLSQALHPAIFGTPSPENAVPVTPS